jgi:hypothetical protein
MNLPAAYRILPAEVPLRIPGFGRWCPPGARTLAPSKRPSEEWYAEFVDRLITAKGRRYLPVCRLSDGEFLFAVGPQPPDLRLSRFRRLTQAACESIRAATRGGRFAAGMHGFYNSGDYSSEEWTAGRTTFASGLRYLAERGVLALHLTFGTAPFQERYFPAVGRWLAANNIVLSASNYVPFYFVYGALTGQRRSELLSGRILVVNGARGEKAGQITAGLRREGATEIHWCPISDRRSLFDSIDVKPFVGKVDLAVVGAGIGKANILRQLEPLGVPCVDAGFVFEVWREPSLAKLRPFCEFEG